MGVEFHNGNERDPFYLVKAQSILMDPHQVDLTTSSRWNLGTILTPVGMVANVGGDSRPSQRRGCALGLGPAT